MIGNAIKRTLVQGGAGLARDGREGRPQNGLGDGFADSISSALERLVSPSPRTRAVPLGMEASIAPLAAAHDDEDDGEGPTKGDASLLEAHERWGASAPWARELRTLETKSIGSPSQLYAAAGGMAVWEGAGLDAHSPFSEAPSESAFLEGVTRASLATLASEVVRDLDAEPMPLVTKRAHLGDESMRTRPTRPEELAGEPAMSGARGAVARVGTVRVGSPEVRERVTRLRPPSAEGPSPLPSELTSPRDTAETPPEHGRDRDRAAEHTRDAAGSHAQGPDRRARGEDTSGQSSHREGARREERDHERSSHGHRGHSRVGRGSESDVERPFAAVHTVPLVAIGDRGGESSAVPIAGAIERGRLELPLESVAANGPAEAAPAELVPYQVLRLDDRTARVELMHPELGRVQVEVHTEQGRVDVELLARSLSASIALRASEPELRGDLRQRGASLRNYRVRTASDGAARALDERQR